MAKSGGNPKLHLQGVELTQVVRAIARRLAAQNGSEPLHCARDLRAAIDLWVDTEVLLAQTRGATYKEIGDMLGVSAQAAHRKYGHRA